MDKGMHTILVQYVFLPGQFPQPMTSSQEKCVAQFSWQAQTISANFLLRFSMYVPTLSLVSCCTSASRCGSICFELITEDLYEMIVVLFELWCRYVTMKKSTKKFRMKTWHWWENGSWKPLLGHLMTRMQGNQSEVFSHSLSSKLSQSSPRSNYWSFSSFSIIFTKMLLV